MLSNHYFNLYLIRHGQSETNMNPDLMGQSATVSLSELGIKQAGLLGKRLNKEQLSIDYVFSSHYTRAFDTARIAIPIDKEIIKCEDLREYHAGDWVGHKRSETLSFPTLFKMNLLGQTFQPPNGESLNQVERRASKWLEETILYNKNMIAIANERHLTNQKDMNIFAFSHGMTIKCLLQSIMGFDRSFTWKIDINNTSISHFSFGDKGWMLHSINDTSHLK